MKHEFDQVISETLSLLDSNTEWINRYKGYAQDISNNLDSIRSVRRTFHEWSPLKLYITTSTAKDSKSKTSFDLRYLGQTVAVLKSDGDMKLDTSDYDLKNDSYFGCNIRLSNAAWNGKDAKSFRAFFNSRKECMNKGNEEHRIESLLLSEFSKPKNKPLPGIQPVKLASVRYPMKTPIGASEHAVLKYSGSDGGSIDILARVGTGGRSSKLCIMEVKDECIKKEPPKDAIKQALAYASFIRELIRSESGLQWLKLFGFNSKIPEKLTLYAVCVMPLNDVSDKSFEGMELNVRGDIIKLHYAYFTEENNEILKIDSSLNPNFKPYTRKEIKNENNHL